MHRHRHTFIIRSNRLQSFLIFSFCFHWLTLITWVREWRLKVASSTRNVDGATFYKRWRREEKKPPVAWPNLFLFFSLCVCVRCSEQWVFFGIEWWAARSAIKKRARESDGKKEREREQGEVRWSVFHFFSCLPSLRGRACCLWRFSSSWAHWPFHSITSSEYVWSGRWM